MKKLSYAARENIAFAGVVLFTLIVAIGIAIVFALLCQSQAHASQIVDPYFQTLPQMQREWEREKYDRKMIDYQVDKQIESDRQLERDRQFEQQLERLHRGY